MKRIKSICAAIICGIYTFVICLPATAFAWNEVQDFDPDAIKHMSVANGLKNLLRQAGYKLLVGLCKFIDGVSEAVNTLMSINLYDFFKDRPFFTGGIPLLATAIASLAVVFLAMYIAFIPEKTKLTETTRNVILCVLLLVSLPTLSSALVDMRNNAISDVAQIDTSSSVQVSAYDRPLSIGEMLLASNTYVLYEDTNHTAQVTTYDDVQNLIINDKIIDVDYCQSAYTVSPYSMEINKVMLNYEWTKYPTSPLIATSSTTSYNKLSYSQQMVLLGESARYGQYLSLMSSDESTEKLSQITFDPTTNSYQYIYTKSDSKAEAQNIENTMIDNIKKTTGCDAMVTSLYELLDEPVVRQYIIDLNYQNNLALLSGSLDAYDFSADTEVYRWEYLRKEEDLAKLDTLDALTERITGTLNNWFTGYEQYLYRFDFDFVTATAMILATLMSLIFCGFKIATMMYDTLFINLVAPLFVASDMQNSGRAKKAINNLISLNILFVVVLFIFKIYLICLNEIAHSEWSTIVKIFLVLGGAKFVIDGPDIVVKIIGLDAGVKSGAAAAMWMQGAARTATGATRTAAGFAGNAIDFGKNVAATPGTIKQQAAQKRQARENKAIEKAEKAVAKEKGVSVSQMRRQNAEDDVRARYGATGSGSSSSAATTAQSEADAAYRNYQNHVMKREQQGKGTDDHKTAELKDRYEIFQKRADEVREQEEAKAARLANPRNPANANASTANPTHSAPVSTEQAKRTSQADAPQPVDKSRKE